jgi:hypothetical protein
MRKIIQEQIWNLRLEYSNAEDKTFDDIDLSGSFEK